MRVVATPRSRRNPEGAEGIHEPLFVLFSGLPAGVDLQPRYLRGIETRRSFRFHFWAVQFFAELTHLRRTKVACRAAAGKAFRIVPDLHAAEDCLSAQPRPGFRATCEKIVHAVPSLIERQHFTFVANPSRTLSQSFLEQLRDVLA